MNAGSAAAVAVLAGGPMAAGLLLLVSAIPRWRASSLALRVAPYIRDVVPDGDLPGAALPRLLMLPSHETTLPRRIEAVLERMLGGNESLRRRLSQAGQDIPPSVFRARQLACTVGGLALGAVGVIALALTGRLVPPAALLPVLAATVGALLYDMQLSARVASRRSRLTEELPTTLEFLALCLSAGEGFLDSLRRIAGVGSGELTAEFRAVVLTVSTGSPLAEALTDMSARLQLPALSRAVDQVVAALERGAPLAGVLHAQAIDAREESKRVLIEQAGRKEILMLLPLVFLILPLSVLFAVYPGLFILRLGIG